MGFGEMPSGKNDLNKKEKALEEDWGELRNVQVGEKELEELLEKDGNEEQMTQRILKMLTTRSSFAKKYEEANEDSVEVMKPFAKHQVWYKDVRDKIVERINSENKFKWENNPGWFGIDVRPEAGKREGNNTKIYATIPVNEYAFLQHILSLADDLREIAEETDDKVKVKISNSLTGFISHNDSIVIHFKNKNNVEKIQSALSQWMEDHAITEAPRELGRSKVGIDSGSNSFTKLVAQNIASWLVENSGKYDNKTLAKLAVKYAIEQSQKSPVK